MHKTVYIYIYVKNKHMYIYIYIYSIVYNSVTIAEVPFSLVDDHGTREFMFTGSVYNEKGYIKSLDSIINQYLLVYPYFDKGYINSLGSIINQ